TTELLHERVWDRPVTDDELVSLLRNWTVGELSTIAASVGIIAQHLANDPELQDSLRAEPGLVGRAVDEMLRIHGPLVANRRVATRETTLRGRTIGAGERVTVLWPAANRDAAVFAEPEELRRDRDPDLNLAHGAG